VDEQSTGLIALQITAQMQDAARQQREHEAVEKGISEFLAEPNASGRGLWWGRGATAPDARKCSKLAGATQPLDGSRWNKAREIDGLRARLSGSHDR
jgi:hypothetical protein